MANDEVPGKHRRQMPPKSYQPLMPKSGKTKGVHKDGDKPRQPRRPGKRLELSEEDKKFAHLETCADMLHFLNDARNDPPSPDKPEKLDRYIYFRIILSNFFKPASKANPWPPSVSSLNGRVDRTRFFEEQPYATAMLQDQKVFELLTTAVKNRLGELKQMIGETSPAVEKFNKRYPTLGSKPPSPQ